MGLQSKEGCPWGQTFFGLKPENKAALHKEIIAMLYASHGSFTYHDIYSMPVQLRRFYLKQLEEFKEKERQAIENAITSN